jgi:hypothetical protein
MKTTLVPLALLIPAVVLAQPIPGAPPAGITQNQMMRQTQRANSYGASSSDSKSVSCDSACQKEAKKAYEENLKECEEAGGTYEACYLALNGD